MSATTLRCPECGTDEFASQRTGLLRERDALQGEVNALRGEVQRLRNAAPLDVSVSTLKQQAIEGLARDAAEGVRKAVLAILRAETRAPEAPGALDATPAMRRLDLDDAGPKIAQPTSAALTLAEGDPAGPRHVPEPTKKAPEASAPSSPAKGLQKCEKCGRLLLGSHRCKK